MRKGKKDKRNPQGRIYALVVADKEKAEKPGNILTPGHMRNKAPCRWTEGGPENIVCVEMESAPHVGAESVCGDQPGVVSGDAEPHI